MNILMLGTGKGSFAVRGVQLGAELGARVKITPTQDDFAWADVVVLIKHAGPKWAARVRAAKKPIVWDALDYWRQPEENGFTETQARDMLAASMAQVRPRLVIGATQAMANVCGGVYLPHHARPTLAPAPVRDRVYTVAYEGTKKYLGRWAKAVTLECIKRGWDFVVNPRDIRTADILIAFRDGVWDGWMCRAWKSGVKLANALTAGRPIILQSSAAETEIKPFGSVVNHPENIGLALDYWAIRGARAQVVREAEERAKDFTLAKVAADYRAILERAA